MPGTHQKTVTVVPVDDAYAWSAIDDATNSAATWITVTAQTDSNGNDTDTWDFAVVDNTLSGTRTATCTVTHSNGTTSDFFTIDQAGTGVSANQPVASYNSLTGTPNPVNEGASVTFAILGSNLTSGTVAYTLSGTGITSGDVGIGMNGTITINGGANSTGSLTVPILSDNLTENSETLTCTLAGTDSNGQSTGNLSTPVVINDTSQTPTYSYTINWDESTATQANWAISFSSVTSNNVTNLTDGAVQTTFTGTPGDTILITVEAGATTGMDFEQVSNNLVITDPSPFSSFNILSEDLTMGTWPNQLTFDVSYVLPGSNATIFKTFDATTVAESTTRQIALHGPLVGSWTCNETSVSIVSNYEDVGTPPQPAVGDSLAGVSTNGQASYLVVAGTGGQTTTGSAINLIGQTIAIQEEEIMGIQACSPVTTTTTSGNAPSPFSPSPGPPSPGPGGPSPGGGYNNNG